MERFSEVSLRLIMGELPSNRDAVWVMRSLQEIAATYLRQREQPETSRPEIGYQLEMIEFECGRLTSEPVERADIDRALQPLLACLCSGGRAALWVALSNQLKVSVLDAADRLRADTIDPGELGRAAALARSFMKQRGDYPNPTLQIAIELLVYTYELATGKKATWSRVPTGPETSGGNRRDIVGSPCGRFILTFFRELRLNDLVSETQISNTFKAYLRACKKGGQSFPLPETSMTP
jgi:hypothetical protein